MFKFLRWIIAAAFVCLPALGQTNYRYDQIASTTTGVGQEIPILALPGATVAFYTGCTALPCGTKATTYTAATGSATCPSTAQVVWQLPLTQTCASTADSQGNFGGYFQPGAYQYTVTIGSTTYGPYQFNVGGSGGGGSGVTSITPGTNVSCTPNSGGTCVGAVTVNATGGSGGVKPGTATQLAYYDTSSTVSSDPLLIDSFPINAGQSQLTYTGGHGAQFTTSYGGGYTFRTTDATSFLDPGPTSQINLITEMDGITGEADGDGNITASATDNVGVANASNIRVIAQENNPAATGVSGSSNITIQAIDNGTHNLDTNSGNITIQSNGYGPNNGIMTLQGNDINLLSNADTGTIQLQTPELTAVVTDIANIAAGTYLELTAPNFSVSSSGAVTTAGSVTVSGGSPGIKNQGTLWLAGTSLPGTCNVGDFFNLTSATSAPAAMQVCYPANTWNQLGTGSSMSGTPTYTLDSGAGTGATATVIAGSTDGAGWISVTTGSTPAASSGVITIKYGGTYATTPRCGSSPASLTTAALSGTGQVYIPNGTSSTSQFVLSIGSTALTASTTYVWRWGCSL